VLLSALDVMREAGSEVFQDEVMGDQGLRIRAELKIPRQLDRVATLNKP
jgi:hypothetical protein